MIKMKSLIQQSTADDKDDIAVVEEDENKHFFISFIKLRELHGI